MEAGCPAAWTASGKGDCPTYARMKGKVRTVNEKVEIGPYLDNPRHRTGVRAGGDGSPSESATLTPERIGNGGRPHASWARRSKAHRRRSIRIRDTGPTEAGQPNGRLGRRPRGPGTRIV